MTEKNDNDFLSKLPDQPRRKVLKSIGGVAGVSVGAKEFTDTAVASKENLTYDEKVYPGERKTGHNIAIINNTSGNREVTIRVRSKNLDQTGSIVFNQTFQVPAPVDSDTFPNVIHSSDPVILETGGRFRVEVETSNGRTASTDFYHPTGRIQANESLHIRLMPSEVLVGFRKA